MAASKESPIPTAAVSVAACAVDVGESDEAGCFFCLFDAALPLPPAAAFAAAAAAFLAAFCVRIYADLLGEGREAEVRFHAMCELNSVHTSLTSTLFFSHIVHPHIFSPVSTISPSCSTSGFQTSSQPRSVRCQTLISVGLHTGTYPDASGAPTVLGPPQQVGVLSFTPQRVGVYVGVY